jgi:para-nitrobenzyl esterase
MRLSREATLVALLLLAGCASAQTPAAALVGTDWQLVRFRSGDGRTLTPDDKAKYTFAFRTGGVLHLRIDCNRGSGGWKSPEPGLLQIGPLAVTRAMCPPGSLFDPVMGQMGTIRSYVFKDGRLYLSLMADGGIFELEPLVAPQK